MCVSIIEQITHSYTELKNKTIVFIFVLMATRLRMCSPLKWWSTLKKPLRVTSFPFSRLQKQRLIVNSRFNRTCAFIRAHTIAYFFYLRSLALVAPFTLCYLSILCSCPKSAVILGESSSFFPLKTALLIFYFKCKSKLDCSSHHQSSPHSWSASSQLWLERLQQLLWVEIGITVLKLYNAAVTSPLL